MNTSRLRWTVPQQLLHDVKVQEQRAPERPATVPHGIGRRSPRKAHPRCRHARLAEPTAEKPLLSRPQPVRASLSPRGPQLLRSRQNVVELTKLSPQAKEIVDATLRGWEDLDEDRNESLLQKWRRRLPPLSTAATFNPQVEEGRFGAYQYLDFSGWSLGDDYLSALCDVHEQALGRCKVVSAAKNRLTAQGAQKLLSSVAHTVEKIDLRGNAIGAQRWQLEHCRACADYLSMSLVRHLDLTGNQMGDACCIILCQGLIQCEQLETLGLARNCLGSLETGVALSSLIKKASELQALDLHWNAFRGPGALQLLTSVELKRGKFYRLDLSWNALGKPSRGVCAKQVCDQLGLVFQNNATLFHLDVSFNHIQAKDAKELAQKLENNHTLFGLHIIGNEFTIDDLGFVQPSDGRYEPPAAPEGLPPVGLPPSEIALFHDIPATHQLKACARAAACRPQLLGPPDEEVEWNWINGTLKGDICTSVLTHDFFHHMRDQNFCWICQNWFECEIIYTVGQSSQHRLDDLDRVFVYTSIDGFKRPHELFKRTRAVRTRKTRATAVQGLGLPSRTARGGGSRRVSAFREPQKSVVCRSSVLLSPTLLQAADESTPVLSIKEAPELDAKSVAHSVKSSQTRTNLTMPSQEPAARIGIKRVESKHVESKRVESKRGLQFLSNETLPSSPRGSRSTARSHHNQFLSSETLPSSPRGSRSTVRSHQKLGFGRSDTQSTTQTRFTGFSAISGGGSAVDTSRQVIVEYCGVKMVPPTMARVEFVFEVNGQLEMAADLPNVSVRTTAQTPDISIELRDGSFAKTRRVNTVQPSMMAWQHFRRGGQALVLCDDPEVRGKLAVKPRTVIDPDDAPLEQVSWTFEISVWAKWSRVKPAQFDKLLDADWALMKTERLIKDAVLRQSVKDLLSDHYQQLLAVYRHLAGLSLGSGASVMAVSMRPFTQLFVDVCNMHSQQDHNALDQSFISARVVNPDLAHLIKVKSDANLLRFQFMEGVCRVADGKHRALVQANRQHAQTGARPASATPPLIDTMRQTIEDVARKANEYLAMEAELQQALFCEECDLVFKENMDMLRMVFDRYRQIECFKGRFGNFSATAWEKLLRNCHCFDEKCPQSIAGVAFVAAAELIPDEVSSVVHMELKFPDFLVALGYFVMLREGDFDVFVLPDMLEDFFEDHIMIVGGELSGAGRSGGPVDPAAHLRPMLSFLTELFEKADTDRSGSLNWDEFKAAFTHPCHREQVRKLGLALGELHVVFNRADTDRSGDVTLDELSSGFIKVKQQTRGIEKILLFLEETFDAADVDNSGSLSKEEFLTCFSEDAVQSKLTKMGVDIDEMDSLFESLDEDQSGDISLGEVLSGFIHLRNPSTAANRLLMAMEREFLNHDKDMDMTLTRAEFRQFMQTPALVGKLKLCKRLPNTDKIFDLLDHDGSGTLSLQEVLLGMKTLI